MVVWSVINRIQYPDCQGEIKDSEATGCRYGTHVTSIKRVRSKTFVSESIQTMLSNVTKQHGTHTKEDVIRSKKGSLRLDKKGGSNLVNPVVYRPRRVSFTVDFFLVFFLGAAPSSAWPTGALSFQISKRERRRISSSTAMQ